MLIIKKAIQKKVIKIQNPDPNTLIHLIKTTGYHFKLWKSQIPQLFCFYFYFLDRSTENIHETAD